MPSASEQTTTCLNLSEVEAYQLRSVLGMLLRGNEANIGSIDGRKAGAGFEIKIKGDK